MTDFFFDPEIFDEADRIYAEVGQVKLRAKVTRILPPRDPVPWTKEEVAAQKAMSNAILRGY
ncbi:MAG: hypothetical protein ACRC8N_10430 [Aeromonas veronii]